LTRDSLAAVYPPPDDSLAEATVRELDDQFFTSDPYAYIRSRITSLLTENAPASRGDVSEDFIRLLGPSAARYGSVDERVSKLQVAIDAFALRHQVAETLLRFLHVVLHHQGGDSHWVELTDTPIRTRDVYKENHATLTAEGTDGEALLRAVLLPRTFIRTDGSVAEPDPDERARDDLIGCPSTCSTRRVLARTATIAIECASRASVLRLWPVSKTGSHGRHRGLAGRA
jgi:hypothetical protein